MVLMTVCCSKRPRTIPTVEISSTHLRTILFDNWILLNRIHNIVLLLYSEEADDHPLLTPDKGSSWAIQQNICYKTAITFSNITKTGAFMFSHSRKVMIRRRTEQQERPCSPQCYRERPISSRIVQTSQPCKWDGEGSATTTHEPSTRTGNWADESCSLIHCPLLYGAIDATQTRIYDGTDIQTRILLICRSSTTRRDCVGCCRWNGQPSIQQVVKDERMDRTEYSQFNRKPWE